MKAIKIIVLFALIIGFLSPTMAQRHRGGGQHEMGDIIEKLDENLDLSDEQVAELETIVADFKAQKEVLREQDFESREEKRAAMKELHENFWTAIKSVLTEAQLAELETLRMERGERGENPCEGADKEGLRAALDAYHMENIEPVLLEVRAGFEENISEEDKATLADLRVAFAAFKADMQALKEAAQEEGADREAIRAQMKELKERMKENFEAMKPLLETYREDIKAAFEGLSDEREQWDADMDAIKLEYLGEECFERFARRGEGRHGHEGRRRGHRHERGDRGHRGGRDGHRHERGGERGGDRGHRGEGHHGHKGGKKGKKAAHFLLLDPAGAGLATGDAALPAHSITLSPNPASTVTTLTYKVATDAPIVILLQDNQGNVLQTLVSERKAAGTYSLEVNLSGYKTGSYYFTLSDGVQRISESAIITQQ